MSEKNSWQEVLRTVCETDPDDFNNPENICISPRSLGDILRDAFDGEMVVDKAWAQFCAGIGDSPDAPYPGMIGSFESHYGQSFSDKDWRNEASVWAAAWKAASVRACHD